MIANAPSITNSVTLGKRESVYSSDVKHKHNAQRLRQAERKNERKEKRKKSLISLSGWNSAITKQYKLYVAVVTGS